MKFFHLGYHKFIVSPILSQPAIFSESKSKPRAKVVAGVVLKSKIPVRIHPRLRCTTVLKQLINSPFIPIEVATANFVFHAVIWQIACTPNTLPVATLPKSQVVEVVNLVLGV